MLPLRHIIRANGMFKTENMEAIEDVMTVLSERSSYFVPRSGETRCCASDFGKHGVGRQVMKTTLFVLKKNSRMKNCKAMYSVRERLEHLAGAGISPVLSQFTSTVSKLSQSSCPKELFLHPAQVAINSAADGDRAIDVCLFVFMV